MNNTDTIRAEQVYIQDSFRFLVCHVGTCEARYYEDRYFTIEPYWTVAINGRLFTQESGGDPTLYVFSCKTEHGTVKVSFLHSKAR